MHFSSSAQWSKVVSSSYALAPLTISSKNNKHQVTLFSADKGKSYSSAPYLTESGMIKNHKNMVDSVIEHLSNNSSCDYILLKLREQIDSKLVNSYNPKKITIDQKFVTFELDLSQGEDYVWQKLIKQKTRNQVRKAKKNNLKLKQGGIELIDDFYTVISNCWRDLGTPTHSKIFYSNIIKKFPNNSQLLVVYKGEKAIATAVVVWNETTIFHPFAGSLKRYNNTSVNNLLYWKIIQLGIEMGLNCFDMGRSQKEQGTYRYKASWGAEIIPLYYYYFLSEQTKQPKPNDHFTYQLATSLWKKIPLPIANFLGPKLIYKVL